MSNRLGVRTRLLGAGSGARVAQWFQRSIVKSVQTGLTNFASNAADITATVTAVVPANAILFVHGYQTGYAVALSPLVECTSGVITNATTLTFSRGSFSSTATDYVSWTLLEFQPGVIKSRQTVTDAIATGQTVKDTTITAVRLAKTIIVSSQSTTADNTSTPTVWLATARLTSTTNVRFERSTSSASFTVTVAAEIVEFF